MRFEPQMNRLVGGAAAACRSRRAQQPAIPVIEFLSAGVRERLCLQIAAFLEGLKESGYVEGQNAAVEYRFAESQFDRFPALASELVRLQVTVLFMASNAGPPATKQELAPTR